MNLALLITLKTIAWGLGIWIALNLLALLAIIVDGDYSKKRYAFFIYPSKRFTMGKSHAVHDRVYFYFSFLFFFHLTVEAR